MERLTKIIDGGVVFPRELLGVTLTPDDDYMHKLLTRLAAYEDAMTLERAQELAQAEMDGRLVVLPCKVGDTVWTNIAIVGDRYRSADKPYPVEVVFIGMGGNCGFFHVKYSNGRVFPFDFDKVSKIVFLTREEAEAALKKREED